MAKNLTFASADQVGIVKDGTDEEGYGTIASLAPHIISTGVGDDAAVEDIVDSIVGNPTALQALAAALISTHAANSLQIASSDGLIYENDAVDATV